MKRKFNEKTLFWSLTLFLFIFNIVGIVIFRNNIRLSINSLLGGMMFIVLLLRGIFAYVSKDSMLLILSRYSVSRFNKYNWPTKEEIKDFYIKATIYFAVLPFYLPLALFSSREIHSLWCVLLFFATPLAIAGVDIRKMVIERKGQKKEQELLQKEKEEQERREELGYWK